MPTILKTYSWLNLCSTRMSDPCNPKVCLCSLCSLSTLLTFVCLPHPRSAWLTFNHTGCWLPGFNLSVIIFWCFHILLSVWSGDTCAFLPEVFMVATGCSYLCGRWRLLIPESSRTTVLFCTSEKFLLMEGQRVPLSYVHLYIIYHQIFFLHLRLLRTN